MTASAPSCSARSPAPTARATGERVHGTPGPRWFAPDSPIARVHGDASMFVGGIRAIMLQSLHPAAMQGVADHSGYRGDMWGRLAQVSTYIAMTTFGAEQDALQMIRAVQRAHESVTGTMPDGTPYAASDPHLLGWVHAAEIDSFLVAHDRYGHRPLVGPERDEYVAQTAVAAEHLGVIDPPRSEEDLRAHAGGVRPELRGTPAAHEAIRFLLLHPDLPAGGAPGLPRARLGRHRAAAGRRAPRAAAAARAPGDQPRARRRGHPHDPVGDGLRPRRGARAAARRPSGEPRRPLAPARPPRAPRRPAGGLGPAGLPRPAPPRGGARPARACSPRRARAFDRTTVALAAWFHDAVYDGADDDEERSARWAERALPAAYADEVARLVRMTVDHRPADDDPAGAALSDADLGILAAPRERYDAYVAGVRADFAHVGDDDFRAGRAAVLRDLVARPHLFSTPHGARAVGGRRAGQPPSASSRELA